MKKSIFKVTVFLMVIALGIGAMQIFAAGGGGCNCHNFIGDQQLCESHCQFYTGTGCAGVGKYWYGRCEGGNCRYTFDFNCWNGAYRRASSLSTDCPTCYEF